MFQSLARRLPAYLFLVVAWGLLCLPNLGLPSLWDIDEGKNAQAAVEMQESSNWIVPTFNYELRADKPPLLYWLQAGGYALFGVNELAARLPSALAALLSILLTYELARRSFGPHVALLAGLASEARLRSVPRPISPILIRCSMPFLCYHSSCSGVTTDRAVDAGSGRAVSAAGWPCWPRDRWACCYPRRLSSCFSSGNAS